MDLLNHDVTPGTTMQTRSKLKAWWLTTFRGYQLKRVGQRPIGRVMGWSRWEFTYVLELTD